MKLAYIAAARIPGEKAHSYQIMKMCEAFAKNNMEVELVLAFRLQTNRKLKQVKDVWSYYGIEERFKITKLPSLDLVYFDMYTSRLSRLRFLIRQASFAVSTLVYSLIKKADIYYTRDFHAAFLLSFFRKKGIFYESHKFQPSVSSWVREKKVDGLVVITNKLKELYVGEGIPEGKILVAPDGVDMKMFDSTCSKEDARRELEISIDKEVVCYTGHFYDWKGTYILAKSMKYLPSHCIAYFVGGTEEDILRLKEFVRENEISNVVVEGYVPPTVVPKYLAASDVLILPNRKKGLSEYTSPLKLFEYMASKRPIVATDLPSIREILDEENAVLVEPDNAKALAEGIRKVLMNEDYAREISEHAYGQVQRYTWDKRAARIAQFIQENHVHSS